MDSNDPIYNLRFNINHYGADYTVDSLVRRMIKREFVFPDFQREYVWNQNEASKFIESLLLGIPVPSLFFAKDKYSQSLIVIDGQQRLRTLQFFFEGEFPSGKTFKLTNVSSPFEGKTFEDLDVEDKFNLENTVIHCVIIAESGESNRMYYLFERLNTTGNALTSQEIRNAIYRGEFNELLKELDASDVWKEIYKKKDNRLAGQELILRFLAFTFFIDDYRGSLVDFLNEIMLLNRNLERLSKEKIKSTFNNTFKMILEATQGEGFYYKKKFNKTLFDTLSVFVAQNLEKLSVDKVTDIFSEVKKNDEFWTLSKGATSSKKSLHTRLDFVNHLF